MTDSSPTSDRRALLQNALQAIETLQARLDAVQYAQNEPIAIVGMSCRFPGGADDPDTFWQLLQEGRDAIREVPPERWDVSEYKQADDENPPRWFGGFLDRIDQFEPSFFGISPREATSMDPQQRLVLEVAWEALERAGIVPETLLDSLSGVFIGITTNDYSRISMQAGPDEMDAYTATGSALNVAAGRVAYTLGLHGPTMAVDTACSSSLTAIHLACQSLRRHESDLALAGGVNVLLNPEPFIMFSRWGMMAPDGRCKTFDAAADGFVRAEGCGVLVLKRLKDAQAAGDPIQALIRGSAVNEDGKSSGLTVPNGLAQQAVIRAALAAAGLQPNQISYVETHGTGTALGDPIEVEALGAVLGKNRKTPLTIGSVKTNIGHAESASGVAGLIKAVLAMQHGEFPPHLHFNERSPRIPWPQFPIEIPTQRTPWISDGEPRRAGVSSFGFSGVNAHIILEEKPSFCEEPRQDQSIGSDSNRPLELLTLSARSETALEAYAHKLANHFIANPDISLPDAVYTLATTRTRFQHRLAIPVASSSKAAEKLAVFSTSRKPKGNKKGSIAFLFTGQGAQYENMGRGLYENELVYRSALDQCNEILTPILGRPLLPIIYPDDQITGEQSTHSLIDNTQFTQPALFAIEYALAELWKSWGVIPDFVMGHSVGEYTAAVVAGVMNLEDGLKLIAARGRLMGNLPAGGEMAAIFTELSHVEAAIQPFADRVSLGAINGPESIVISGESTAVQEILAKFETEAVKSKALTVSHAFHSPLMEPILDEFEQVAAEIQMQVPNISLLSNVTAQPAGEEVTKPSYWRQHIRQPVRFHESIAALFGKGCTNFIEIGPSPTLLSMAQRCLPESDELLFLPSLRKGREDNNIILTSLGELYMQGVEIHWDPLLSPGAKRISLPTYPYERERYWVGPVKDTKRAIRKTNNFQLHPLLQYSIFSPVIKDVVYESRVTIEYPDYLNDHRLYNVPILPGTGYLEIGLAAANQIWGPGDHSLERVEILEAMVLPESGEKTYQIVISAEEDSKSKFKIYSLHDEQTWQLNSEGNIVKANPSSESPTTLGFDELQKRCTEAVSISEYYQQLGEIGIDYGPTFKGISQLWKGSGEAFGQVSLPETAMGAAISHHLHPALLDACFQVLGAAIPKPDQKDVKPKTYVPIGCESYTVYLPSLNQGWCHVQINSGKSDDAISGKISFYRDDGQLAAQIIGLQLRRFSSEMLKRSALQDFNDLLYQIEWKKQPIQKQSENTIHGCWVVFSDRNDLGESLIKGLRTKGNEVIVVNQGKQSLKQVDGNWQIDPGKPEDFKSLMSKIVADQSKSYRGVIYLWGLDLRSKISAENMESDYSKVFGGALHLAQALASQSEANTSILEDSELWLVTRGSQAIDGTDPAPVVGQSGLWGFGRSIMQEKPGFSCFCIDLDPADSNPSALLTEEISFGDRIESQIAYRKNDRLVPRLVRTKLKTQSREIEIRSDATYLITGGLGGLGLTMAKWLVNKGAGNLILMGRSAPTETAKQTIADLSNSGAEITVALGDVSKVQDMTTILSKTQVPLRGIIHAAGVLEDGVLHNQSWDRFQKVFAPKVIGTWNLHTLTDEVPLDFFILFSAGAALFGSAGQTNYAAANAFMDGFAHFRHKQGLNGLSINWGAWSDVGMAAGLNDAIHRSWIARGIGVIHPDQGVQIIERLLGSDLPQIAVLPIDWQNPIQKQAAITQPFLNDLVFTGDMITKNEKQARAFLNQLEAAVPKDRYDLIRAHVQEQVANVLRLDTSKTIDPTQGLTELGMDSLMAVELSNQLKDSLNTSLPKTLAFEYPTIEALANYLLKEVLTFQDHSKEQIPQNNIEQATTELDNMSENDLEDALLKELEDAGY